MQTREKKITTSLNLACWVSLCIFTVFDFISISVAQIAATIMGIAWVGRWVLTKQKPDFSPLAWPVAAFVVTSLISAALSVNPAESFKDSKDLFHFVIFFAAYDIFLHRIERVGTIFRILALSAGAVAVVGIIQGITYGVDMEHRVSGFQSIYMTYAGLLMLSIVVTIAIIFFDRKKWDKWLFPALALMLIAILYSLTRNSWVGVFVGIVTVTALWRPKFTLALPFIFFLALVLSPSTVWNRATDIFNMQESANRGRLLMWEAGFNILSDNKVFGVGQNSVPLVYKKYRNKEDSQTASHLHNNVIQIAAERGLVGLAAWLAIWIIATLQIAKTWRRNLNTGNRLPLAAGIGCIFAFQAAGVFEYNFGDSEVQMLMFLILAAAMAVCSPAKEKTAPISV